MVKAMSRSPVSRHTRGKKGWMLPLCLTAIAIVGIMWWSLAFASSGDSPLEADAVIATVNDEPIIVKEVELQMARLRSQAVEGDEASLRELWKQALDESLKVKVQQLAAKQRGLTDFTGYDDFLKRWQDENQRRKKAIQNNQVIYGPQSFDEPQYYDFFMSDVFAKLKKGLFKEQPITQEAISSYYTDNMHLFRNDSRLQTNMFSVSFGKDRTKEDALAIAEAIKQRLIGKERPEEVAKAFENSKVDYRERLFNEQTERHDTFNGTQLWNQVQLLKQGEISEPIEENGSFNIFICVKREEGTYQPFEKAKAGIEFTLMEREYPRMVNQMVEEAEVWIDELQFNRLTVR